MCQTHFRSALTLRPYQLLCMICSLGEGAQLAMDDWLNRALETIQEIPDIPVTLQCNAGDVYFYQDSGTEQDTPEGAVYNRKRDLDILQRIDLAPGSTLPARTLLMRVLKCIDTVQGVCGYDTVTSESWQGCPKAEQGHYERGHEQGITGIIPPRREEAMADEKARSIEAILSAGEVTIRPHILMCAVCQYGSGVRSPYAPDNLPEFVEMVLHVNADVPVTFAKGADWMMCAPCPMRVPEINACVNVAGSGGLSNEKRDLDLLQKLGLTYGSTMPARELLQLLLERVPTTQAICRRDNPSPSVWWDGCGEDNIEKGNASYEKGREMLLDAFQRIASTQEGR